LYPFIEAWVTGDDREHHLNDLPYNAPVRTGLGVAWIMVYLILALAATNDLIAIALDLSINDLTWAFRIGIFVAPVLAFFITKRLCLSIQRQKRQKALHGEETSRVVRTGTGGSSLRAKATSCFCTDRIEPVTPAELRAALEHSGHEKHVIDEATGGDYSTPAEKTLMH